MPDSSINWDDVHPTNRYAAEVVMGLRDACKRELQACQRHLSDLERQATPAFPYVFDESRADRIYEWFERCCRHVRGLFSSQLIELLPFQKFDLGGLVRRRQEELELFNKSIEAEPVKGENTLELTSYQWNTLRAQVKALLDAGTIKDAAWLDKIDNKTLTTSELAWLTFTVAKK